MRGCGAGHGLIMTPPRARSLRRLFGSLRQVPAAELRTERRHSWASGTFLHAQASWVSAERDRVEPLARDLARACHKRRPGAAPRARLAL